MVASWVKSMVEDVMGGSPVRIGAVYEHPEDGKIRITSGRYWGEHGLSNFWSWTVLATGEAKNGYANWQGEYKNNKYVEVEE